MVESGRLDDAAKEYAIVAKNRDDPSLPEATAANRHFFEMLNSARLLTAQNKFDAAKAELDMISKDLAARADLNRERAYNGGMGFLELAQKDYQKAAQSFANSNPADPYMWYYRAVALERAGDKKGASSLYLKVVNWNSLDTPGHSLVRSRAKDQLAAMMK
jgi:tetratricopeptide (TPR) repeat protein